MKLSKSHQSEFKEEHPEQWRGLKDQILLKVPEVAALCGVSRKTVDHWIESEQLPVIQPAGRGARPMSLVARADLDTWIEQHRSVHEASPDAHKPSVSIDGRRFVRSKK